MSRAPRYYKSEDTTRFNSETARLVRGQRHPGHATAVATINPRGPGHAAVAKAASTRQLADGRGGHGCFDDGQ